MVTAWRSEAGPARAQLSVDPRGPRPVVVAVSPPPVRQASPEVRQGTFQHLEAGYPPGAAAGGQHPGPGLDAAFLFGEVQQHERGVGDLGDGGEGGVVRIVDHDRPRRGVDPLPQGGGAAWQGEGSGGAWFAHAVSCQLVFASFGVGRLPVSAVLFCHFQPSGVASFSTSAQVLDWPSARRQGRDCCAAVRRPAGGSPRRAAQQVRGRLGAGTEPAAQRLVRASRGRREAGRPRP
jgi:hypothetical protein